MINVWIPCDKEYSKFRQECKALYESVQNKICDKNSFEFIEKNTYFYLFEDDGNLIGGIYYFMDGKLYLNGFAKRKMHSLCLECLKMSLRWFKSPIYAQAQNRASALCLLKCGFKRIEENIFVYMTQPEQTASEREKYDR